MDYLLFFRTCLCVFAMVIFTALVLGAHDVGRPTLYENQKTLKTMMLSIDSFMNQFDIHYIITSGTLLGAVRHADMIPWDDDIDLALPESDAYKLIAALDVLKSKKMYLTDEFGGSVQSLAQIQAGNGLVKIKRRGTRSFVDLFFLRPIVAGDSRFEPSQPKVGYVYSIKTLRHAFKNEWFYNSELVHRQRYTLGRLNTKPLIVQGPSDFSRFLTTTYGDYMQEKVQAGHQFMTTKLFRIGSCVILAILIIMCLVMLMCTFHVRAN